MDVSILARDTDTVIDRCTGSCDGLCPRVAVGEPVYCAGLRLHVDVPAPAVSGKAERSWVWRVGETAASCPVWLAGQPGVAG